jgi:hypothetical protein
MRTHQKGGIMKWLRILAAIAAVVSTTTYGQTTTAFNFLRTDVGARAAGMAGSFVSVANDPVSLFYNPGALATLDSARGSLGYFKNLLDFNSGYAVYGRNIADFGYVAAGIVYANYGSFDQTDESGNINGTFSASDIAVSLGYGNAIEENLTVGAAVKFIHSSIAGYHSSAVAADAGILYRIPDSRFAVGASVRTLGTQLSTFAGVKESLPVDVTVGASIIPKGIPLFLNVNFHNLTAKVEKASDRFRPFTVGGEFTLSRVIALRIGYNNELRTDLKTGGTAGMAGFSGGLGIKVAGYTIDYALSSLGTIGSVHRISLGTAW